MYKSNYKFVGSNYIDGASTKEVAKRVRTELKNQFPNCKFSVTKTINTISIALMQTDFEIVKQEENYEDIGFNYVYIKENIFLTDKAKELLQTAFSLLESYNFDNSDSMTDYFHQNFYSYLRIGKWDKPFTVKN